MKTSSLEGRRILVVGLGLIGGSYAQGLTRAGYEVGAIVRRQATLDYALGKGIVSHGSTEVDKDYVGGFDIVVFALYPRVFEEWIAKYQGYLRPGAIITDVTGVKTGLVSRIQPMLRPDVEFVPAHPMAGKEVYGVENCDCGIFRNANFILTPTERNTAEATGIVIEMAKVLGFKKISTLTPAEHDEMIGFLSQLTHCIAVALMNCKEPGHLADYTGDSFRDLTRIARINEDMWCELFMENREELLSQMDLFLEKFSQLRDALSASDTEAIKEKMRLSTARRACFDKE